MTSALELSALLGRLETFGVRLGLETTRRLLAALGAPHQGYPVILVAGTNGKGSTAAFLASMAGAAGYRTGLYTSPHLESVTERIRIEGRTIDLPTLGETVGIVVSRAEEALGYLPTYFETLTAAAFLLFTQRRVDLAVLEVGLGGRLDATNAAEPVLALITEIGLEHQRFLGNSLTSIAREKAGILRPDRPAIAWVERDEVRQALSAAAGEVGAELLHGPDLASVRRTGEIGWENQQIEVRTAEDHYQTTISLLGEHQLHNLALAILGAEALRRAGFPLLTGAAIRRGAATTHWPGRLERVEIPGAKAILLDVAHNPDGVASLMKFLDRMDLAYGLLFGALDDKEVSGMLPPLAARAGAVVLTESSSERSKKVADLVASIADLRPQVEPDARRALTMALAGAGNTLVVCGSVYLVGEIRAELYRRFGVPTPAAALVCGG